MKIIGANVTGSFILNSQDVTTTIQTSNVWSGSVATDITALNAATASLNAATSSLLNYTASNNAAISDILLETASINTFTSSINSRVSVIEGKYATTGSNTFFGTQTITGSLFIANNLVVQGTSSLQNITASAVSIGTNTVILNTDTPAVRFGGIKVQDSGSGAGASGSLLWDSQNNHWIYQHPAGGAESGMSARLISGPKNSGSLGNEAGITSGKIVVAVGDDHIGDSIMTQTGTVVSVAGDLTATSLTGSINGSQLTNSTVANAKLASSTISGISLGSNLATLTIGTGLSGTSYNGSTGVTIANSGVTSIVAGTGISINQGTGAVTVTNTITNNNQLTNGAGYITSAGNAATVTNGVYTNANNTMTGGNKIVIQNSTDGGSTRGIFMWNSGDPNWGIYMATSGAGKSLGDGTAPAGLDGRTDHAIRFRVASSTTQIGFLWENSDNTALMQLQPNTGTLLVKNRIILGVFPNSTTNAGEAWIGRASDRNQGTMTVQLGGNSATSRSFEVVDYAWTTVLFSVGSNGNATASGDVTAYSDARIKTNIKPIDSSLEKVLKLTGVTYNRTDLEDKSTKIGFIAQEIEKVVPEVVTYDGEKDKYSVSYGNVTALLVEAIKEQQTQIEELKSIINGLTK